MQRDEWVVSKPGGEGLGRGADLEITPVITGPGRLSDVSPSTVVSSSFPDKLPLMVSTLPKASEPAQPFRKTSCPGCLLPRVAQRLDHRALGSQAMMYD